MLPLGEPVKVGNDYWESFDNVEGTGFRGTAVELKNVATAFARLHKTLASYPYPKHFAQKDLMEQRRLSWDAEKFKENVFKFAENEYAETLAKNGDNLEDAKNNIPWSVALHNNKALLDRMMDDVSAHKDTLAKAPQQATHGDLHPHEVIMRPDGTVATFTALGKLSVGPRAEDVGMAVHRFVREYAVKEKEKGGRMWQETVPEGVKIFLDAYLGENPFSPEEIDSMMAHATNRQLEKLYTRGKDNTPKGQSRKPGDSRAIGKWLDLALELPIMRDAVSEYQKRTAA